MRVKIETIYRFRVDLASQTEMDEMDAFYRRTSEKEREPEFADVYCTYTGHGPCWTAYYICESANRDALESFARHVETIARHLKITLEY